MATKLRPALVAMISLVTILTSCAQVPATDENPAQTVSDAGKEILSLAREAIGGWDEGIIQIILRHRDGNVAEPTEQALVATVRESTNGLGGAVVKYTQDRHLQTGLRSLTVQPKFIYDINRIYFFLEALNYTAPDPVEGQFLGTLYAQLNKWQFVERSKVPTYVTAYLSGTGTMLQMQTGTGVFMGAVEGIGTGMRMGATTSTGVTMGSGTTMGTGAVMQEGLLADLQRSTVFAKKQTLIAIIDQLMAQEVFQDTEFVEARDDMFIYSVHINTGVVKNVLNQAGMSMDTLPALRGTLTMDRVTKKIVSLELFRLEDTTNTLVGTLTVQDGLVFKMNAPKIEIILKKSLLSAIGTDIPLANGAVLTYGMVTVNHPSDEPPMVIPEGATEYVLPQQSMYDRQLEMQKAAMSRWVPGQRVAQQEKVVLLLTNQVCSWSTSDQSANNLDLNVDNALGSATAALYAGMGSQVAYDALLQDMPLAQRENLFKNVQSIAKTRCVPKANVLARFHTLFVQ